VFSTESFFKNSFDPRLVESIYRRPIVLYFSLVESRPGGTAWERKEHLSRTVMVWVSNGPTGSCIADVPPAGGAIEKGAVTGSWGH
jgi:hypothetical protein